MKTMCTADQKGFSVIELLMVVAIVGLLATVAVPSLLKSRDAAEKAAVIGSLHTFHITQTGFYTHNGRYANIIELNNFAGKKLGNVSGNTLIRSNYIFYSFPDDPASLKSTYSIIAIRFRDRRIVSAFILEQDGRIESLFD